MSASTQKRNIMLGHLKFSRRKLIRCLPITAVLICFILFQGVAFLTALSFSSPDSPLDLQSLSPQPPSKYVYQVDPPSASSTSRYGDIANYSTSLAPHTRRVDSAALTSLSAAVDKLNLRLPNRGAASFGNLSRFTALRNNYFDVDSKYEGVHFSLRLNSTRVVDVTLTPATTYASGLQHASTTMSTRHDLVLNVLEGFAYNQKDYALLSNYTNITPIDLQLHRHPNLARLPTLCRDSAEQKLRPWLLEFSNVWMTGNGEIFLPISSRSRNEWDVIAYQYQGGCCVKHWPSVKRKRIVFRDENRCAVNTEVGFSVAQNHGVAYFHVTNEVIPRLLTFWEVALSVLSTSGGRIAAPSSTVVRSVLRSFGVPSSKMLLLGLNQPCFFQKLYVPAPFHQGSFQKECVQRTAARIVGENAIGKIVRSPKVARSDRLKPVVVLIERALSRRGGQCQGTRCMVNFPALRRAIEREFRGRIDLQILSAGDKDVMRRGIDLFSRATVVVGMHGAGFTNIMFMRGKGTYVIHLGWNGAWQIYGNMAQRFGVNFVNIVTHGASQNGRNAVADIPVIVLEIRRCLQREGFPLDTSRMATKAWRSAVVSMRLSNRPLEWIQTKIAKWDPFVLA